MFLTPEDYKPYIRKEIKEDILLGQTALIQQVELAAQAEITSYLAGRYDVSKIFTEIRSFKYDATFPEGAYVYDEGKIYKSLATQTETIPSVNIWEETSTWALEDPRNPIIVLRMVYITLYHAHKALPGQQIPKLRIDDYDISLRWLEKVAAGLLNPLLPEAEREDGGLVAFGSEPRRQSRW